MGSGRGLRERWIAVGLGVIFAAACLVAAEVLVSVLVAVPSLPYPAGFGLQRPRGFTEVLRYDPRLFWRQKADVRTEKVDPRGNRFTVETNALGLRDDPWPPPGDGPSYRVLSLGDSNTWGQGVEGHQTYSNQLERILSSHRPDLSVGVLNAGVVGYSSAQSLRLERELLRDHRFDLVLIYNLGCDKTVAPRPDREHLHPEPLVRLLELLHHSAVFRLARYQLHRRAPDPDRPVGELVPRASPGEYRDNLVSMVDLASEHGADTLLVLPLPVCRAVVCGHPSEPAPLPDPERPAKVPDTLYQDAMRSVARETGAGLVDLTTRVESWGPPEATYLDSTHPTVEGHRRIARVIAESAIPIMDRSRPREP